MKLYMIRHGETDWNVRHVLQGTVDIPLNARGIAQAEMLAARLERQHVTFDRIFCSPLTRAKDTARIALGIPEQQLYVDPRLTEIEFGPLEGSPYELQDPEKAALLPPNLRHFGLDPDRFVPAPGGESFQDVIRRTGSFLKDLLPTIRPEEKVVLVSHGCCLHGILYNLCGKTQLKDFWEPLLGNCRLMEWDAESGQLRAV